MTLECVHVITQEQANQAYEILGKNPYFKMIEDHGECIIYLDGRGFDKLALGVRKGWKIYSFEEFLIIKGITNKTNKQSMEKQMLEVLNKTYDNLHLRRTTVPLFMSNPGIGKTTIIQKFAKDRGVQMKKVTLSQRMPNEVVGGMMPDIASKTWETYDNSELQTLKDGDILFFDEVFNGTLKQTLDALLNLLEDRTLPTGKKLADVMIVAASNPQGLINLTPQIKQRFEREDLKFNSEEFQAYLKNKYGMPESISSHICTLINKEKFEPNEWNFVTPRSVEKAINKIGCELKSNYDDILLPYLTKTIESPMDISKLNVKKGDQVEYVNILKLLIANSNAKLQIEEETKNPELTEKRLAREKIAKEKAEKQAQIEQELAKAKAAEDAKVAEESAKPLKSTSKVKPIKTTTTDDSTNHK